MEYKNIIGVDETGVGDYFTPLISVSAFVPKENWEKVLKLGIKDSKKISNKNIIKLYYDLKDLVIWKQKKLTPKGYNVLNRSFNAHELKTLVHLGTISELEKEVNSELVIVDEFASEKNWNKYVNNLLNSNLEISKNRTKIMFVQKAEDKYIQVAVASIIARAILLFEMKKQNEKWEIDFPLGASQKTIDIAKEFVKIHGRNKLNEVAKLSFKTTDKV